jgi:pyruvate/2-oxoglutarate dehydrogenase complex dihydrolipoamide dehydrogenase (E3) component
VNYDFDVAVIGGGSGGYAAARTAANAGLKTIVFEGAKEIGGLCILHGCMPSKALLYAAERLHIVRDSSLWGIESKHVHFNFAKAMARKKAMVQNFADYRRDGLTSGKFKFVQASARFLDPHTVELSTGKKITAKHFVISTGSVVAPPPLPQLAKVGYLTSDEALRLIKLPKSLIILGGGAIACEFAQFMARFGTKVTLIQRSPHVLNEFDTDAAETIEKVFRRERVDVYAGTKLLDARRHGGLRSVVFKHKGKTVTVSAEQILFALGRKPNTASLGLELAGVKTENGRIKTNEYMQTSAPHIYAAGDCVGPHDIVHIAVQQGEAAGLNIVKAHTRKMNDRLHLVVVFTDPQVAQVGLNEKQAQAQNLPYIAASYPFNDHGKSIIMEANDGFVKLLANPKTGEIIGGACTGPVGGELIHEIVIAMASRMTVQEFMLIPHYHPTLAEIWTYPAEELAEKIA